VQDLHLNPTLLHALVETVMPYGKYQGRTIADIPEHYLVWLAGQGFPKGKLGKLLALMYEIRLNGLEDLLKPLQAPRSRH
jgi:uncharacterized protein (DUF3820 family)